MQRIVRILRNFGKKGDLLLPFLCLLCLLYTSDAADE